MRFGQYVYGGLPRAALYFVKIALIRILAWNARRLFKPILRSPAEIAEWNNCVALIEARLQERWVGP